jgi:hypothetical protein
MPRLIEAQCLSPAERRREVAAILARGVLRWRGQARTEGIAPTPDGNSSENGLEFRRGTRLSVSDGTRGLRLRDDGDNA